MHKIPNVILMLETSRAHGQGLLRGIAKYSRLHGPWTFYRLPPACTKGENSKKTASMLKKLGANGIFYWPNMPGAPTVNDFKKIEELVSLKLPMVIPVNLCKKPHSKLIDINTDASAVCKMAGEHLIGKGFRQFAFCGYDVQWSKNIGLEFGKIITRAGYNFHTYYKKEPGQNSTLVQKEQVLLAKWLKSLPKPLGLMACNDDLSGNIIEACKISDIHVPQEIAIVGVDNDEFICELSHVPLSSVVLDMEKAAYEAAEQLDRLMSGKEPAAKNIIIKPTHVVTRQSTNVLAIEDGAVAKAVWFISQHYKEPIQVRDVVEASNVSRRVLEQRFKKSLKHSILDEIRRQRSEYIAKLLVETNLPLLRIALDMGFTNIDNMSQYFRRTKGVSLRKWRKIYSSK